MVKTEKNDSNLMHTVLCLGVGNVLISRANSQITIFKTTSKGVVQIFSVTIKQSQISFSTDSHNDVAVMTVAKEYTKHCAKL